MILSKQEVQEICTEEGYYDCHLVLKRFGYTFFQDNTQATGNIICFESSIQIGSIFLDNALVVATELPNTNMFGGVCFQRLYCSQLGSLFSSLTQKDSYLNDSVIFIEDTQATIVITNRVKESILSHIVFPLKSENEQLYHLDLKEQLQTFKEQAVGSFYQLTQSLFIETQRDNF
jgi:hypothetical protein